MRILLLGASGQIGSEIYKELKSNSDNEVIGTSRKSSSSYFCFDPFKDDWQALGKADVLINAVGQIEETSADSFEKVHGGLTQLIVKHRTLLGNPRVIQISVLGADKSSPSEFMHTKAIADDLLLSYPDTTVVRPSIVCTPGTVMVKKMKMLYALSKFTLGYAILPKHFPEYKFQPVMVKDLAVIISRLCVSDHPPKVLNVVGPEALSYYQIMDLLFTSKGKSLKLIQLPKKLADFLIKNFISVLFPSVINKQQYYLVFQNNVSDKSEAEKYVGGRLSSTIEFWKQQFK